MSVDTKTIIIEEGAGGMRLDKYLALRLPDEKRIADILRRADQALYQAKEMGRNCTVDASPVSI